MVQQVGIDEDLFCDSNQGEETDRRTDGVFWKVTSQMIASGNNDHTIGVI